MVGSSARGGWPPWKAAPAAPAAACPPAVAARGDGTTLRIGRAVLAMPPAQQRPPAFGAPLPPALAASDGAVVSLGTGGWNVALFAAEAEAGPRTGRGEGKKRGAAKDQKPRGDCRKRGLNQEQGKFGQVGPGGEARSRIGIALSSGARLD